LQKKRTVILIIGLSLTVLLPAFGREDIRRVHNQAYCVAKPDLPLGGLELFDQQFAILSDDRWGIQDRSSRLYSMPATSTKYNLPNNDEARGKGPRKPLCFFSKRPRYWEPTSLRKT
jgi:hypothetical protein